MPYLGISIYHHWSLCSLVFRPWNPFQPVPGRSREQGMHRISCRSCVIHYFIGLRSPRRCRLSWLELSLSASFISKAIIRSEMLTSQYMANKIQNILSDNKSAHASFKRISKPRNFERDRDFDSQFKCYRRTPSWAVHFLICLEHDQIRHLTFPPFRLSDLPCWAVNARYMATLVSCIHDTIGLARV